LGRREVSTQLLSSSDNRAPDSVKIFSANSKFTLPNQTPKMKVNRQQMASFQPVSNRSLEVLKPKPHPLHYNKSPFILPADKICPNSSNSTLQGKTLS